MWKEEKIQEFIDDNELTYTDCDVFLKKLKCPYCRAEQTYINDDGYLYKDGEILSVDCEFCERTFTVEPVMDWTFTVKPTPYTTEKFLEEIGEFEDE